MTPCTWGLYIHGGKRPRRNLCNLPLQLLPFEFSWEASTNLYWTPNLQHNNIKAIIHCCITTDVTGMSRALYLRARGNWTLTWTINTDLLLISYFTRLSRFNSSGHIMSYVAMTGFLTTTSWFIVRVSISSVLTSLPVICETITIVTGEESPMVRPSVRHRTT